ncbi:anti-sigma factor family protein [Inquilinus sp.]|jgi:anti-sigma factor RsiW|uniref:anti-sigma factor family protein n=1 Tax=Inquilinus sp. TaxID=1932117 RepID=UPI00378307CC
MSCPDKSVLLHGMLDGELDVVGALAFEAHLKECPACAAEYRRQQAIRTALRRPELRDRAPDALRRRIEAALQPPSVPWWRRFLSDWRLGGAGAAALAMALMLLLVLPRGGDDLARQLVDSHVRSLLAEHLVDVPSSDRHTVKPWFVGKIDAAPPVVDLAAQGFPLAGGRLDYLDRRVVAALVYRHGGGHVVNLFVWASPGAADSAPKSETEEGYRLLHWVRSGLEFWAVADIDLSELQAFQAAYQEGAAAQGAARPAPP